MLRVRWQMLAVLAACAVPVCMGADRAPAPVYKPWQEVKQEAPREFKLPQPERVVLPNGAVIFLLEDHELPLIDFGLTIRAGSIYDPEAKSGLAALTAETMRSGGTAELPGDRLDETLDTLAVRLNMDAGLETINVSFACLKEDFARIAGIVAGLLKAPALPQEKFELALSQARTRIAKRNDNPPAIASREFPRAMYTEHNGKPSPWVSQPEYATLQAITRNDLAEFQRTHIHPGRFIITVAGAFQAQPMRKLLEELIGAWPAGSKAPELPPAELRMDARTLWIERPQLNQATLVLGHAVPIRRDHADYPALALMNEVFSGSMAARLFTEIRTKKGLAYSVYGGANLNFNRPALFSCSCLTRNEQALEAADALRFEITRMRDEGVTQRELDEAREGVLNSFVFNYDTPAKTAQRIRTYELYGYPLDFDQAFVARIRAATVEDVNRVAKTYLDPARLTQVTVGSGVALAKGLEKYGKVEALDVAIPTAPELPLVLDPEKEARGKRLLEEAVVAAGGVQAFGAIDRVRTDLVMHVGPLRLRTVMRIAMPDRVRADVAGPFGPVTQIMTKDQAWQASGGWVKEIKPDEARKNLRALLQTDLGVLRQLASGKEGYNVQALDPLPDAGRALPGVLVESAALGRVKLYFDPDTKLLLKLRYALDGSPREHEKAFSGHEKFGALMLARRIEDNDPKARARVVEMTALELHPALDDALFARPERATPPPEPAKP